MNQKLQRLYETVVPPLGETYGEHKKNCLGCRWCAGFRFEEKRIKEESQRSVAGVSGDKVMVLRRLMAEGDNIDHFYADKAAFRDKNGKLKRDVYLVLKLQGFKDTDIRDYFGVNTHEWQVFKKREFPDWQNTKDGILANEAPAAMERWRKSPRNHYLRHRYLI